jgi:hypothetical protein
MDENKVSLPKTPAVIPVPGLPMGLPNDPELIEKMARLLDAQIATTEDAASEIAEKHRLKTQDKAARLKNAKDARAKIEATLEAQRRCAHKKAGDRSALSAFNGLPDPVTYKAKMQILCSRCMFTDEGDPHEMREKYMHNWPGPQSVGGVQVDTEY